MSEKELAAIICREIGEQYKPDDARVSNAWIELANYIETGACEDSDKVGQIICDFADLLEVWKASEKSQNMLEKYKFLDAYLWKIARVN